MMNLNLKEWNESINYGNKICEKLKNKGYNVKIKDYSIYNGDRGLYLQVFDANNKLHIEYATGIQNDLVSMKNSINYMVNRIENEC